MKKRLALMVAFLSLSLVPPAFGIDDLKLNPKLNYDSDSNDGPLITGSDAKSGFVAGKTNYVIIYGEECFNSKRQARRTVELYNKYRSQVHFVAIDINHKESSGQEELVKRYYKGTIPHVVVLDAHGNPLYDQAGEVDSGVIEAIFEKSLGR